MITITLIGPRDMQGNVPQETLEVQAVPRVGEDVDYAPKGIRGTVRHVIHHGDPVMRIIVEVR